MTRKVYELDYRLLNPDGEVVDTSLGGEPLVFLEGSGQVVKGLELAVHGREVGEVLDVTIPPELAYGARSKELVQDVHISQFDGIDNLQPGMTFQTQSGDDRQVIRVVAVEGERVVVDGNHPLAGISLHFELQIRSIREASDEEVRLGYPMN